MKYDKKHVKLIFEKIFTSSELRNGNLTGESSHAHKKADESSITPVQLDINKVKFARKLFEERLAILSKFYEISLERSCEQQFKIYVREALAPYKRRPKE